MKKKNTLKFETHQQNDDTGTDWVRLDAMSDAEIDISEIPELDHDWFQTASIINPNKKAVSLDVDEDVFEWFNSRAKDSSYQILMQAVLKAYVKAHK